MNLTHLGDALDHWKGSLFESLQGAGVLTDFAVDPVVSDLHDWTAQHFCLYARLLRVDLNQVLRQQKEKRLHTGDLFIDPDTGVATGRRSEKHVMPAEVRQLLDSNLKRIVAVYQHAARGCRIADRVDDVLGAIRDHRSLGWCSYESGTVAMLFLSRDHGRATTVSEHFRRILGLHADERIRCGVESEHGHV